MIAGWRRTKRRSQGRATRPESTIRADPGRESRPRGRAGAGPGGTARTMGDGHRSGKHLERGNGDEAHMAVEFGVQRVTAMPRMGSWTDYRISHPWRAAA